MNRSCVFSILLTWVSVSALAPAADAPNDRTTTKAAPEVFDRVVFIRCKTDKEVPPPEGRNPDAEGGPARRFGVVSATGFFLRDREETYLVTARHVGVKLTPQASLSFVNEHCESRMIALGGLLREPADLVWRHHETADVSVVKIFPRGEPAKDVAALCVEREALMSTPPSRGAQAMACGFFMREGTHERIAPLVATVHVASEVMPVAFDGTLIEAFLVHPPTGSGFSGGPVYWRDEGSGRSRCIGVTSGVIGDQSGGKFSTVMPCSMILDLLD